jgi:UDP-N-acetyl-D-galactosamine dehydrogenase
MTPALSKKYDAIVLTVAHKEFRDLDWDKIKHGKTIVYDVKGFLDQSKITARL